MTKLADFNRQCRNHAGLQALRNRLSSDDPLTGRLNALNDQAGDDRMYGIAVQRGRFIPTITNDWGTFWLGLPMADRAAATAACESHAESMRI